MTKLIYVGESDQRVIVATSQTVTHGEPFEVDTDLAKQLLEQDIFERAPAPKATKPAKAATQEDN